MKEISKNSIYITNTKDSVSQSMTQDVSFY